MARGDMRIPERVLEDIKTRLQGQIEKTLAEFESAEEDEDVLTGHLGANLTTHARQVWVSEGERTGYWTWSLKYRKFRGRGAGATEKKLGADGIFEVLLNDSGRVQSKSMLFQSKMAGPGGARQLAEQCAKLSTWREAAAVFSYATSGFEAMTLDAVLGARGDLRNAKGLPLDEFLANVFVKCVVGDTDLRYVSDHKMLTWIDNNSQRVATRFTVRHRFKIGVKAPGYPQSDLAGFNEILNDEIAKHRMRVNNRDLLGVDYNATTREIAAKQRQLMKIYHPDMWVNFSPQLREAMELIAKEIQSTDLEGREI